MTLPTSHSKIKRHHLDRLAIVYIRQSTLQQVNKNVVSKERQFALRELALNYGWIEENIIVVDCDQAISATWHHERKGFDFIFDEVAKARVGAIFCLEVTRLSREDDEFSRLVRLCMWTKTLIIDDKTVYDPCIAEDMLVLDIKGMAGKIELRFINDRLQGARRLLMEQGKYRFFLPTGYVYNNTKKIIFDPRIEVQETVRLFFDTFERLGSAMAVVKYFEANNLKFPTIVRGGEYKGEIKWSSLTHQRALAVLHNATYAGTYAAGRSESQIKIIPKAPYKTKLKSVKLDRDSWKNVIHDAHPSYISWEQFLRNEQQLQSNQNKPGENKRGAPRTGVALLQGLAVCQKCHSRMYVLYPHSHKYQYYTCCRESIKLGTKRCQSFRGSFIDEAITDLFLQAFKPAELELTIKAHQEAEQSLDRFNTDSKARIKRAKADLKKIEERYDFAADHKDTRMAHRLAKEYEKKEAEVIRLEQDFSNSFSLQPKSLSIEDCQEILKLEHILPEIWHSASTEQSERKALLRLVIERVILNRNGLIVNIVVCWKSGVHTPLTVRLPSPAHHLRTDAQIINIIRTMGVNHSNEQIADHLNKAGYRNRRGNKFTKIRIKKLRYRYRYIDTLDEQSMETDEKLYTMAAAARLLGINVKTTRRWLQQGYFEGMQEEPGGHWLIKLDTAKIATLRKEISNKIGLAGKQVE